METRTAEAAMDALTTHTLISLTDPEASNATTVGSKAARLSQLARDGYRVPTGAVIPLSLTASATDDQIAAWAAEAVTLFGDEQLAVRSSAAAEDLADSSFAGLYDSVIGVRGHAAVAQAIRQVIASADADWVDVYGADHQAGIAVLIQALVEADSAGVAFTADPVTGERGVVLISAVSGLGEQLVSGEVNGEEWRVRESAAASSDANVLTAAQAEEIANVARMVEASAHCLQDIEWAIAGGELYLLQARPLTAVPEVVDWTPSIKRHWRRDFRLGEWLPAPVTPSFETWALPQIDVGMIRATQAEWDIELKSPLHVVVNGWYYTGIPSFKPPVKSLVTHTRGFIKQIIAFNTFHKNPDRADRWMREPSEKEYRDRVLPQYQEATAKLLDSITDAQPAELIRRVDDVLLAVGGMTMSMAELLGFANKAEAGLAFFYNKQLAPTLGGNHQVLLQGVVPPQTAPAHAVTSLDWSTPTLGEIGVRSDGPTQVRFSELRAEREAFEDRCRSALASKPKRLAEFNRALEIAHESSRLREEMTLEFTLAWPGLRAATKRLGSAMRESGVIATADDVYFLTADEVRSFASGDTSNMAEAAARRRDNWRSQARLAAPLTLGKVNLQFKRAEKFVDLYRSQSVGEDHAVVGMPASPGSYTGPVRIVRNVGDFAKIQEGDVLVAPVTAPAWTPLFRRASAVVTDSGSLFAHASLIAREYGLPAVVGTGNATTTLRDGMVVTVDGSRGVVDVA